MYRPSVESLSWNRREKVKSGKSKKWKRPHSIECSVLTLLKRSFPGSERLRNEETQLLLVLHTAHISLYPVRLMEVKSVSCVYLTVNKWMCQPVRNFKKEESCSIDHM